MGRIRSSAAVTRDRTDHTDTSHIGLWSNGRTISSIPEGEVATFDPLPHRFAQTTLQPTRPSAKSKSFVRPRELERYTLSTQDGDLASLFLSNRAGVISALEDKVGKSSADSFRYWSEDPTIRPHVRLTDKLYDQRRLGLIISRMMRDITLALAEGTQSELDIRRILEAHDQMRLGDDPVIRDGENGDIPASLQNPTNTRTLFNLDEKEMDQVWDHALRRSLDITEGNLRTLGVVGGTEGEGEPSGKIARDPFSRARRLTKRLAMRSRRAKEDTSATGIVEAKYADLSTAIAPTVFYDPQPPSLSDSDLAPSSPGLAISSEQIETLDQGIIDDGQPVRTDTDGATTAGMAASANALTQVWPSEAEKAKSGVSVDQQSCYDQRWTDVTGKMLIALTVAAGSSCAVYGLSKWLKTCAEEKTCL